MKFAFDKINLNKVIVSNVSSNLAAEKSCKKLGLTLEESYDKNSTPMVIITMLIISGCCETNITITFKIWKKND